MHKRNRKLTFTRGQSTTADAGWHLEAARISAIFYDFDGVMTDNRIIQFQDGTEAVIVNRADGLGIQLIKKQGIPQLILSTETNPVVTARARKLRIEIIQGCENKRRAIKDYCRSNKISLTAVLFVGNDVNDLSALRAVGYPVCPADANSAIMAVCRYRLRTNGGYGAIRELADHLC